MNLVDDARALQGDLVQLRRVLHREPEVGLDLPRTQERVLEALAVSWSARDDLGKAGQRENLDGHLPT